MQSAELNISGSVVFWNCAVETDVRRLTAELELIGESEFLPGERTPFAALKRAAAKLWKGEEYHIANLKDREGITVEKVTYGETENTYDQIAYATLNEKQTAVDVVYCKGWETKVSEQEWRDAADYELNLCAANAVGIALAKAVEALDGYRLRPTGGVYFLPNWQSERFARIAAAYEAAGFDGNTQVHRLEVAHGDQTIRSVHSTITERIRERVAEMRQELADGLKKAGRRNRLAEVNDLAAKVAKYESLLQTSLSDVQAELANVQTQLAMEQVAASADLFAGMDVSQSLVA
jgi:hypothetical protein